MDLELCLKAWKPLSNARTDEATDQNEDSKKVSQNEDTKTVKNEEDKGDRRQSILQRRLSSSSSNHESSKAEVNGKLDESDENYNVKWDVFMLGSDKF